MKKEFQDHGMENIDVHLQQKRKYYKKIGVADPEVIKQMEFRKSKEINDSMNLSLQLVDEYGSVYEIEDEVMRYICMNKPPKDKEILQKLNLPFKSLFIETEITKTDVDITMDAIKGMLITEAPIIEESNSDKGELKYKTVGRGFKVAYLCMDQGRIYIDEFKLVIDHDIDKEIVYDSMKDMRFFRDFVINFLLFINDPEIELISHVRSAKNRARRIQNRKMPLPSSKRIRLTGTLKKYIDSVSVSLGKMHYNYRFWVRGHSRVLRSERYTHKQGQIISISPYQKGQGVLLKRTYSLDFKKGDVRAEEIKEGTLDYEDI
jgi:hypothetical protein